MDPKLLRMYSDILNEQGFPQQYALRNTEDPRITAARQQATASTPTPGTAAAVRGARGGTGPVTAPQAARPATPLPGDPNAPAYQKDPSQSKKVGTGASGFGAPQAAKPAATTSTSQNIKAAGAAFQSQQPAQTAPGGGPNNAETLAAKLGQTAPAAKTPDAMAGSDAGDQTSSGYSLQSQAQKSPDNAMAGSQATASQTQTSNYTGQDVRTANARDANAAPPTQGFVGGAAPAATPSPATAAPAGPMSKPTMPATPASPGGPSATTVGGKENTVGTTSGTLQSAAGPVTSGAGIKKDAFGTPQFEEELEEETDESIEEEQLEEAFNEMLRLSGIQLNEKAVSKQQQKFMGMVHAMQKGEKVKGASPELKKVARDMGKKDAKDFASTKHKGLPQKVSESVVLEAGTNLEHIVTRFKHETKRFLAGDDLDSDLYEALYDYYADAGEMPYGVAKARDGDPYQWVSDHFADELALMGYDRQFQETVIPVVDNQLSELARLAGLSESRVDECDDMAMDQRDSMNVSTNMSSDGTKSVTISAQGDQAEALIQMLKLAGMGHMGHSHDDKPVMVVSKDDDEMMDEEYKNSPNNKEYHSVASILSQGNDLNKPKNQDPGTANRAANPMAEEIVDEELQGLLDSVLIKADEGSIKGGDRPGDLTGTWSADPSEKGKPNVPPPIPMDPVSPAAPKAPSSPAIPKPGIKK